MNTRNQNKYVREWHYRHFFSGQRVVRTELDVEEHDVIRYINRQHGKDNWQRDTLQRKGKVKRRAGAKVAHI